MSLDPKKEIACKEYVLNGGDRYKAYRKAYPHSVKWKDKTVWSRASELFADGEVQGRVEELQAKAREIAETKLNITFEQKQRWLKSVIERSLQHEQARDEEGNPIGAFKFNAAAFISAINELNKMDGDHAASKVDMTAIVSLADFADSLPDNV
jgi:phage terminase small subunit